VLDLKAGDYIQAYCWLDRFEKATNPGQFDVAEYLARKNIFVAASVNSREAIELLRKSSSTDFFVKIKRKAREVAVQSLLGGLYPQDESERLLQALVLGYRAGMDIATYEAFRRTGLLHFVCLSGMNFGIFVGMIWWLCKSAGLTRRIQALVCLIAAAMFVLVIPPNPPAFRAAIICLVFCLSFFFRRQSNPFNSLALAAVILLIIKPMDLFDLSWQLSFAAVLGILLFASRIHFFLYEKITGHSWFERQPKTSFFARIVAKPGPMLLNLFSVSLAAWLASSGILLFNFYTIQPLTSIWTVIASPFIAIISFLGYFKLLIGLVLPTAASILNEIIRPLSNFLIWLVMYGTNRFFTGAYRSYSNLADSLLLLYHFVYSIYSF
jgi:competence protein ComEC